MGGVEGIVGERESTASDGAVLQCVDRCVLEFVMMGVCMHVCVCVYYSV